MKQTDPILEFCVLIPCYNNLQGLKRSLESIRYEEGKFRVVVVDDGSEQPFGVDELLPENKTVLPVHIIRLPENGGITNALNTGLKWIWESVSCTYIARLDCGDICDPQRFFLQMKYLRANPYTGLLGSWCWFQSPGKDIKYKYVTPERHRGLKRALYFRNAFIHPTVIYRLDLAVNLGFYPSDFPHAEDYALFWKMTEAAPAAVIPAYLVVCELNGTGISSVNRIKQLHSRLVIVRKFGHNFALKTLGILKIEILMKIPYRFILNVKKLL